MTRLTWYKRYPADFRDGTRRLSFEERGFYGDVLDLIYESGNALVDDDAANAHRLHADLRTFRRLKARLVELGKLYLADGMVRNGRADAEATAAATRIAMARDHGKLGGEKARKSVAKSSNFNGSGGAGAQAGAQAGAPTGIRYQEEGKKDSTSSSRVSDPAHAREEAAAAPDGFAALVDSLHERVAPAGVTRRGVQRVVDGWVGQIGEARTRTVVAEALACATGNPLKYAAAIVDRRAHALDVGKHAAGLPLPDEPDPFLEAMLRPARTAAAHRSIGHDD